jgi:hypothetical protein
MGKVTRLDEVRRARRGALSQASLPCERRARARRYRLRAEELRAISEEVMLKETCLTLVSLAESYEQMARAMERVQAAPGPKE